MLDYLIVQAKFWLLGFLWENYISWFKVMWAWSLQHPLQAPFVWFCLFGICFAAYGTLRRMWEDGSFAALHITQKATLVSIFAIPAIHAYLFDILVMRVVFVTIFAQVPPWYQDWKFWSASWTFSRWVSLFKDRTKGAKWWNGLLHAIEPHGH